MITHAIILVPIGQVSCLDQIVQRLSNATIAGLLEPKEQSLNETDLVKTMGVSRIIIREALNTFRVNSLIHTVRGHDGRSSVCENIDGKNSTLYPFKAISTDYLSNLGEMYYAVVSHGARLASRWIAGANIVKFREFAEALRKANSLELMTQVDMRCLLMIAVSSYPARLVNQESQVQAEWASLVVILHHIDSTRVEITALYSALADALAAHNEAESAQLAT